MTRVDLQALASERLREAEVLMENACFSGAYYLAGYAVECALKACIARATVQFEFPDLDRVKASYTHNIAKLVHPAVLDDELRFARKQSLALDANWALVEEWTEQSRYEIIRENEARELVLAMAIM